MFDYRDKTTVEHGEQKLYNHRIGIQTYYIPKDILDKINDLIKDCNTTIEITEEISTMDKI